MALSLRGWLYVGVMPVEFLSDDQVAVYAQFAGPVSRAELERFFFLDDRDLELVGRRRGAGNRLGFVILSC